MSNAFVKFQALLQNVPVTRGEVTIVHNDDTVSCKLSNDSVVRVADDGRVVGDFVYLKGDAITGKAPSISVTEVII